MMVRPPSLKGNSTDSASSLTWQKVGDKLKANNPTPFYMNLKTVRVDGVDIKDLNYLSPFSTQTLPLLGKVTGSVIWTVVTDFGGESREYRAPMK